MIGKLGQPFGKQAVNIINLYVKLRYSEGGIKGYIKKFKIMVKKFRKGNVFLKKNSCKKNKFIY